MPGTVSFAINGSFSSALLLIGSYSNNVLAVGGSGISGSVSLSAPNVTGPGPYSVSTGAFASGSNAYSASSGSIVVTSLNPGTRRASGTFTAAGPAILGAGRGAGTNGVFTNLTL